MDAAAMKLLSLVLLVGCCGQGTAQLQSCHDTTGCGGNVVTGVSTAEECCLGSGLSFRNGSGICRQCIVHGFVQATDLVINEGATQEVITMTLDVKGNTRIEPASTRVLNFAFSFTCIDSSNGGGPMAVDGDDYTDTGCGSNIQLRLFPSAQSRSEVGINAVADDIIEGTEVLILRLMLTSATQTAFNNAGNIFLQDTLNIRVIDVTVVVIGFSEDDYTADEGEPSDVSRPNTPCTVTVEIIERTLEIPLQIKLTPGEGNATRRDFNDTIILTEVPIAQTQLMQAIQIFDDEINEGREVFYVSLEVVGNISNTVQYRIRTTLCRIRQNDPIEIGFTQRRVFHTEMFQQFDTLINKHRASEQSFTAQVELSTLSSPFGPSATRGEDFNITASDRLTVLIGLEPSEANRLFDYFIYEDNTPENQEVFQLSITPAIGSPTFTCTEANGCFQQLEIVIVDDDVVVVGFVDTLVEVNETDGQATLNVSISFPAPDPLVGLQIMFSLRVDSMDGSAASYSALDTLRNPVPEVEDFPRIVDSTYFTFQEMPFNTLEFSGLNQMFNETRRSQTFTFPIFVDDVPEGVEELQLTLSLRADLQLPPGSVNVTPAVATVRIQDFSLITVGYIETTVTVLESDGVAQLQLTVAISAAQLDASFSLLVNTSDGTATAPGDYGNLINFRLDQFSNSVRQLSFNVSIVNDDIPEDAEGFNVHLRLDPADQARLGNYTRVTLSPEVATVTIQDDEAITAGYVETAVNVSESDGVAQLTVAILVPPEVNQIEMLFFLLVNTLDETATATAPSDYGTLTNFRLGPFNNSVRQLSFNVSIVNDNIPEDDETFSASLTLDPAAQDRLGSHVTVSPNVATVTIQDNDALCIKIFQLLLGEVNDCTDWRVQNVEEKLADITSSIISTVNSRCQCSLTVNHISTAHFLCTSDRHVVLYRAELSGHSDCEQVLSHIEQWIGGSQTHIVVQGTSIEVYPNCPIEVDSLPTQMDCVRSTTIDTVSESVAITAIGGGVGGVVLIGIMILAAVVYVCRYKHKRRTVDMKSNEAYGVLSMPEMKSNEAYGICHQRTCQQPNENNQMAQFNQPPIISPLSPHSGDLSSPTVYQIGNDASYATVTVEEGFDESYENVEPDKEHSYEMVDVPQSPSEYDEPRMENVHANT